MSNYLALLRIGVKGPEFEAYDMFQENEEMKGITSIQLLDRKQIMHFVLVVHTYIYTYKLYTRVFTHILTCKQPQHE